MSYFEAIILGIAQGITEFLPISSSGHLLLLHSIFGQSPYDLSFDAVLQLATLFAVLIYFWRDILSLLRNAISLLIRKPVNPVDKNFLLAIIYGTIPAVVFGLFLEQRMETTFRSAFLVALSLIAGSILMLIAERISNKKIEVSAVNPKKGFYIGIFQALALIPGISRSGSTISGGLINGLSREEAAKFSFILSFPIIFGSGLKKLIELLQTEYLTSFSLQMGLAFIFALIFGVLSIRFLIRYLKNNSLNIFIFYRIILAAVVLVLLKG